MENYNNVNTLEFKIKTCLIDFEYLKTFELTEEEKNKILKHHDLIFVYNRSLSNAQVAFFTSLRKIFAYKDNTKTFDELDESIKNKYIILRKNVDKKGGLKKYINTQVLHTDENKAALEFKKYDEMYENVVKHLYDLFYELTSITFFITKHEPSVQPHIPLPGNCKSTILKLITHIESIC